MMTLRSVRQHRRNAALACLLLACLVLASMARTQAAEPPVGIVDEPCPEAVSPSPRLRDEATRLYIEPRALTAEDFGRFLQDPEIIKLNEENLKRAKGDWAGLCRYRAANHSLLTQSSQPRIVFIGDSITENWTLAAPEFFSGGIVNRGIGGQTTPQILLRFRADVIALRPAMVHILAGTNDIAGNTGPTTAQDYKNHIMSMAEIAQANGITIILGSIPPAASFPWRPQVQTTPIIRSLNTWLRDYAASKNIGYLDYYASLAGPSGELRSDLGNDGVHPNRKGYALMRQLVEAKLPSVKSQ